MAGPADEDTWDITFLFASPLTVMDGSIRNRLPPLDVDSEFGAMREACRDANWGVKARFEVATRTSMQRCIVTGTKWRGGGPVWVALWR